MPESTDRARVTYVAHAEDAEFEEMHDAYADEKSAYESFANDLDGEDKMATLRVSKIPDVTGGVHPTNAKTIHCFACPIDRYNFDELIEYIREYYGGGIYRLIGVQKGQRGHKFNRLVQIAEPLKKKDNNDSHSAHPQFDTIARTLLEMQERTEQFMGRLMQGSSNVQQSPNVDPWNGLEKMVAILATLNGVIPKPGAQGGDVLSELERLAKFKELGQTFFGSESDSASEKGFYDLATEGLRQIGPLIQTAAQRGAFALPNPNAQPAPGGPQISAPQPAPDVSVQPEPALQQSSNGNAAMKQQVDILVINAEKGIDAEQMAETILNLTPEGQLAALRDFVSQDDCVARMAAMNPAVMTHESWFSALRQAILDGLSDD